LEPTSVADVIVRGGPIYTLVPDRPWAEALAVRDGRILAVGRETDVLALRGPRTRVVDADGGMVLPGLVDVHSHLGFGGQAAAWEMNLAPTLDVADILAAVRQRAEQLRPDEWVAGGVVLSPVFHAMGSREMLAALDEASLGRPVLLRDDSLHNRWVNSRALRILGIHSTSPDPAGGSYARDEEGRPVGLLLGQPSTAAELAAHDSVHDRHARDLHSVRTAVSIFNGVGVTATQDAAIRTAPSGCTAKPVDSNSACPPTSSSWIAIFSTGTSSRSTKHRSDRPGSRVASCTTRPEVICDRPPARMKGTAVSEALKGEYFFNGASRKDIPRRLTALEEGYDPGTVSRLENLGVGRGWTCLEVGAGAGSITRWLSRRVGVEGRVVAVDLDTSFLDVSDADNVEVRQLDLRSDELPESTFDLIHTRFVLGHIPERVDILDSLIGALRPGGWLLLEEMDIFAWGAVDSGLHPEVLLAGIVPIEKHGFAPRWGREMPALLRDRGVVNISAVAEAPIVAGGSPGLEWLRLTFDQMMDHGLPFDVPGEHTYAEWRRLTTDSSHWFTGASIVAARGQRQGT
jgi:SAM-dependent methyltransferase